MTELYLPDDVVGRTTQARGPLIRWYVANATVNTPQSAAPITFGLLALAMTGHASNGAGLVLAMTLAQILGAVPVARLGERANAVSYLRLLLGLRAVAHVLLLLMAATAQPYSSLLVFAALGGVVDGAIFGYLRAVLNRLVHEGGLPRALAIASTLGELTNVLTPVMAAVVGSVSPLLAVAVASLVGLAPLAMLPRLPGSPSLPGAGGVVETRPARVAAPLPLSPAMRLWLLCATAETATTAAIEIGAVALALRFGLAPGWAALFSGVLCAASVGGGLWVSVRNRRMRPRAAVYLLAATTVGALMVTTASGVAVAVAGAVVIGCALAPQSTFYSLVLDDLAPAHKRPEMFATLRTAKAIGTIVVGALLAFASLRVAEAFCVLLDLVAVVTLVAWLRRSGRR